MKFIKLTQATGPLKGSSIYINSSDISFIRVDKFGTFIAFSGGSDNNFIVAQEDIDTIIDNLSGKRNDFVFSIK